MQKGSDMIGEAFNDQFGYSVSMADSNTLAVGANVNDGNGNNAGHVRIYEWDGTAWLQKGTDIDGEAAGDFSGQSLSMPDSITVAIGAAGNDGSGSNAGHVRIYRWNGFSWVQKGSDIDGEAAGDLSGWSVSMADSNNLAIGAYDNGGNGVSSGHVRIFQWQGTAWVQKGIDINGESTYDEFGRTVSMANVNTFASGAPYNDDNGVNSGYVRVFRYGSITDLDENEISPNSFSIYPNPSSGELSVQLEGYSSLSLQILDLSGKLIQEHQLNASRKDLDLTYLAEGIYFVRYGR